MAFIEVQNVRFSYDTESVDSREVLHGINLSIEAGEFVALLGHNGCGKSTMAKLFNGMLLPTSGSVLVDGIDTQDEARQFEVRSRVGLVQQNPDNQLVAGVVEEDVAFGPENLGVPPLEIRKRVDEALKAVDMYEYREHAPHKLSGGQKQRVAIARAMANDPAIILADEPTGALDSKTGRMIMDIFHKLNYEQGKTIVLITHSQELAEETQRIVTLKDGEIIGERSGSGC